ncbi:MAG: hypothetical protein AAF318_00070 [Pseudomonadota bacterium]
MAFDPASPCCATLQEVVAGPGGGADPAVFVTDDDVLMMVIGMVDTPGGLGLFDHAVLFCPFCGQALQDADDLTKKAPH